jgi:hypothetical protein
MAVVTALAGTARSLFPHGLFIQNVPPLTEESNPVMTTACLPAVSGVHPAPYGKPLQLWLKMNGPQFRKTFSSSSLFELGATLLKPSRLSLLSTSFCERAGLGIEELLGSKPLA